MARLSAEQADRLAAGMAERMRQRAAADPAFAEDITSINESLPYIVRFREGTPPIRCECCGTLVTMVPETEASVRPWAFKPAIWEAEACRKHTLRRCNRKREQTP